MAVAAGGITVLRSEIIGRGHAEMLLPTIEAALAEAGIGIGEIGRIAVTVGPGSFTGIRVGVAAARGLALVTGAATIALTTLEIHAEAAMPEARGRPVLVVIDGRRGDLYGQAFSAEGAPLGLPRAARAEAFARDAADLGAMLAGSGAMAVAAAAGLAADRILHTLSAPDPAAVLRLALQRKPDTAPPKPLYLRPADATPLQIPAAG